MKLLIYSILFSVVLFCVACQKQHDGEHEHDSEEEIENSPNQALYDQVMDIHDEVMPKMNDLYKAKTSLKTRLALPGLGETEKQEINTKIARIDSASESMMVWMRHFDPIPDSVGEDKARAYLESELVKVKKVKEGILAALKSSDSEH
jgi:hypothetical protein